MGLGYEEAYVKFELLFDNRLSFNEGRDFLISLHKQGESIDEILAASRVMRSRAIRFDIDSSIKDKAIDIVGTGGDMSNSFNISSTTALVLASFDCFVLKHGAGLITSKSGSADMLKALGINISLDIYKKKEMLNECNFAFLYAVDHFTAMSHIMPIRKSIPHRTIFNILGPLANPAFINRALIGVFSVDLIDKVSRVLKELNYNDFIVVHSRDGLDEISISDITYFRKLQRCGEIKEGVINPRDYGFYAHTIDAIRGNNPKDNAKDTYLILKGELSGAKRDIVILNTAFALSVLKLGRDIKECIEMAIDVIDSKRAFSKLKQIIKVSNTIK